MTALDRVKAMEEAAFDLHTHFKMGPPYNAALIHRLLDVIRDHEAAVRRVFGFKG